MGKDRKTLTDADIVSQRTPPRRAGQDRATDADAGHAPTDHDAGQQASGDRAHAPNDHDKAGDKAGDSAKKTDGDLPRR
jgi:hypothetical protein